MVFDSVVVSVEMFNLYNTDDFCGDRVGTGDEKRVERVG